MRVTERPASPSPAPGRRAPPRPTDTDSQYNATSDSSVHQLQCTPVFSL